MMKKRSQAINTCQLNFSDVQLCGRELEINNLHRLYEECAEKSKFVILHGTAGSGKTHLVQSQQEYFMKHGLFVSGKFNVLKSPEPFSAIIEVFTELSYLLCSRSDRREEMKSFLNGLSMDDSILRRFLPSMYEAVGMEKVEDVAVSATAGTNQWNFKRLENILKSLIKHFCSSTQRIVMFLDDVHWADQASLDLLLFFASQLSQTGVDTNGFLFIMSYREEDIDDTHPIKARLSTMQLLEKIHLQSLSIDSVNTIISQLTKRCSTDTKRLAAAVHHKTGGNPFFVRQFLQWLQEDGFLYFSSDHYSWEWVDEQSIKEAMNISDNMVDLVALSIDRLPIETREALTIGSCLGSQFPLNVVTTFFSQELKDGEIENEDAKKEDFCLSGRDIHFIKEVLDIALSHNILTVKKSSEELYMWSHDKIRQAVYSLIPEGYARHKIHMRLGLLLWEMSSLHPKEQWMVFLAADQFGRGSSLISEEKFRSDVALLNLKAAELSMARSAFYPAADLLRAGIKLLDPVTRWTEQYDLCIDALSSLAEIEHALGNDIAAKNAIDEVFNNANCLNDKFRVESTLLECLFGTERNFLEGSKLGLKFLKSHGLHIPARPKMVQVLGVLLKLKKQLKHHGVEGILNYPQMTDPVALGISKLLALVMASAFLSSQHNLAMITAIRSIQLAHRHGISSYTPFAVAVYGCSYLKSGEVCKAYEYGLLTLKMLDKLPLSNWHSRTATFIHTALLHIKRPFHESLEPLLKQYRIGVESGDTEFASFASNFYCMCYLTIGLPLAPLRADLNSFRDQANRRRVCSEIRFYYSILLQTILNLQSKSLTADLTLLNGEAMNQDELLEQSKNEWWFEYGLPSLLAYRLQLAYIFGEIGKAQLILDKILKVLKHDPAIIREYNYKVYIALASFAVTRKTGKKRYRRIGRKIMKDMENKIKLGSLNYYHILLFLHAEDHAIDGSDEAAVKASYDEAIKVSTRSGFMHHAAMINERAGLYFINDEAWASFYLSRSLNLYLEWGATAKVERLKEAHRFLQSQEISSSGTFVKARPRYRKEVSKRIMNFDISESKSSRRSSTQSYLYQWAENAILE